tara:strand:+ start:106 stop:315 length:210 start_codon:yes stop_codon:yes gene_type:complete
MKQNPKKNLTPQQISEYREMNKHFEEEGLAIRIAIDDFQASKLHKPKPPTEEAIKRAQFVDKTYVWTGK